METTASELARGLAAGRERLFATLVGVTEEQFKRRPAVDDGEQGWCIAEVLAHLLATERLWAERIELALRDDGAPIAASDPAVHEAQARAGRLAPVPQLIHGLLASGRELQRLIEQAERERGFERAIEHPRHGRCSVAWILTTYAVGHADEHVAQIEALREQVGATRPAGGQA